jgi:hypothetical protein
MGIDCRTAGSPVLNTPTARSRLKSRLADTSIFVLLAFVAQMLRLSPAAADPIFALVTLTNNSSTTIFIPAGSASTGQVFGFPTYPASCGCGVGDFGTPGPGALPAGVLGPGQTTVFGTMSNGGFLATTGTGGQLDISAAQQTLNWSAPWGNFNGLFDTCYGKVSNDSPSSGSTFTTPPSVIISGGYSSFGYGPNACVFAFTANDR